MEVTLFKWGKDLLIGIDVVDEQHYHLVELINECIKISVGVEKVDVEKLYLMKDELFEYVNVHFSTEEKMMEKHQIDNRFVEQHVKIHRLFAKRIDELFSNVHRLENKDQFGEVVNYLVRWLAYHILDMDKRLANQIDAIVNRGLNPQEAYEEDENIKESAAEPLLKALQCLFSILTDKNNELTKANSILEEKVMKRTEELNIANDNLLRANSKLEKISMIDELTGLPNRRYAIQTLKQLINSNKRYGEKVSLLYIDLDKFKSVNDQWGHEVGDKLLRWIGGFLKSELRKSDIPCRLGGDEFLVICSCCTGEEAKIVGEKLNNLCKKRAEKEKIDYWTPSLSIGIAEVDEDIVTASDLLRKSDLAMYTAKNSGGGRAVFII